MKQIIIFLLVIILLLIGFSQYKKYKRFTPPEYEYTSNDNIDLNYHDQTFLLDYYKAIEQLNGYVISQWSYNGIDVRNPEDDNEETQAAISTYSDKLAVVKFYEDQLLSSNKLKGQGLSNPDIKMIEEKGMTQAEYIKAKKDKGQKTKFMQLYKEAITSNDLRLGSRNAFIYEFQKLLVKKGYDIPVDGVYKNATAEALRKFEESKGLFPDGKLDALTLEALLN